MHIMTLLAAMAIRTVASFRSSSSSSPLSGASSSMRRMIRPSTSNHDARRLFSNNNSARYSVVESDGDYESMTVSELRELLRSRGLVVSGIKAQLVERLGTGTVNPRKVGNSRPMEKTIITTAATKPKKAMMMSSSAIKEKERWTNSTGERRERKRNERPTLGDITTVDNTDDHGAMAVMNSRARRDEKRRAPTPPKNDDEVMIPPPFTIEQSANDPTEEIIHDLKERIHDLNRISGASNLVFAMDGEEESDDEWDSDDEDIVSFDSNGLEFDESDDYFDDPNETNNAPAPIGNQPPGRVEPATTTTQTFKEDFQGTRVFVQGLPVEATWKDLKDHFKRSLPNIEVVFASVSIDKQTGKSKECGIVQFETPTMAQMAIREMRDHPMDGAKLYVRGDVQESIKRDISRDRGVEGGDTDVGKRREEYVTYRNDGKKISIATEWKRANEKDENGDGESDSWYNLKDEELKEIEDLILKRDAQRRQNNYKMSDKLRETLKEEFGVHLDDRLKLWWTDTKHGGVPGVVSEIKGEGRWGSIKPWKQLPTDPGSDSLVDSNLVMRLLTKRDGARKRRAFKEADELLQQAYDVAGGRPGEGGGGGLSLRIHDESRTWRIWTERPPPKKDGAMNGYEKLTAGEMCIKIVDENEPDKVEEMRAMLAKFPGREWNIFKRLKGRYNVEE